MSSLWDPATYGGTKSALTVGMQWQPIPLNIVNLQYSKNIYTNANGPQLEDDYSVMLTWYYELVTSKSRRAKDYVPEEHHDDSKLGF
jgi:hypothetical protein